MSEDLETDPERRGAHRRHEGSRGIVPIVVIAVLAVVAAVLVFGVVNLIQRAAGNPEDLVAEVTEDSAGDEAPEGGSEQTEAPEEEAPVEKTANVSVLNGTSVAGKAAEYSELLSDGGWNVTETGNESSGSETTTVYYSSGDLQAQAELLARELGVDAVEEDGERGEGLTLVIGDDRGSEPAPTELDSGEG